jgi:hypothetical protein
MDDGEKTHPASLLEPADPTARSVRPGPDHLTGRGDHVPIPATTMPILVITMADLRDNDEPIRVITMRRY